jgi:hypothetical protein
MQVHCEFPEDNNKKVDYSRAYHGRLKELVAGPSNRGPERWWGPSNRGPERWWAMAVITLATFDAFVHQDVYNAIAKAFMEEEANVVNKEEKKGINQGRKMGQHT